MTLSSVKATNTTPPDPPTPAWWRWATEQIGGQREAARRLRVTDRAVRAWCAGDRTAPWAAAELLRRMIEERG
jgi:hypothetical protein